MPIVKPIENGQIPEYSAPDKTTKSEAEKNKDMFMQLLVAEMQYQDPLEPTDNSQYVQQLYSMSQTESILAVQENVEKMQNKTLVGQFVTIHDPETGGVVEGKVESVVEEKDGTYVYIDGEAYKAENISAIHDQAYFIAVDTAHKFSELVANMPTADNLKLSFKDDVTDMVNAYNSLSKDALGYISSDTVNKMTELVNKMNALVAEYNSTLGNKTETEKEPQPSEGTKVEDTAESLPQAGTNTESSVDTEKETKTNQEDAVETE